MDLEKIEELIKTYLDKDTEFENRLIVQARLKQFLDDFNKNMASEPMDFEGLLNFFYEHTQAKRKRIRRAWGGQIWKFKSPEGHLIETGNLREHCRNHDLPYFKFLDWLRNGRIYDKFQGWGKVEVHDPELRKVKAPINYRDGKLLSIAKKRGWAGTPERAAYARSVMAEMRRQKKLLSTSGTN